MSTRARFGWALGLGLLWALTAQAEPGADRDAHTGASLAISPGESGLVDLEAAWAPSGQLLALSRGNEVLLIDAVTYEERARLQRSPVHIAAFLFSPDSRFLCTQTQEDLVTLHDVKTAAPVLQFPGRRYAVVFSPSGRLLASREPKSGALQIRALPSGELRASFQVGKLLPSSFTPDETQLRALSEDGVVQLVDVRTGRLLRQEAPAPGGDQWRSARGWQLRVTDNRLWAKESAGARTWSAPVPTLDARIAMGAHLRSVEISADGTLLATTIDYVWPEGEVRIPILWELQTGRQLPLLRRTESKLPLQVNKVSLSPDGQRLLTEDPSYRFIGVWDARRGQLLHEFASVRAAIPETIVLSEVQRTLTVAESSGRVWSWQPGGSFRTLPVSAVSALGGSISTPGALAVHPGRPLLAVVSTQGQGAVGLWEGTRRLRELVSADCRYPAAAAFSPDGNLVAVGCDNGQVELWATAGSAPLSSLAVLNNRVEMVRFTPDGKTLLIGGTSLGVVDLSKSQTQPQVRQVPLMTQRLALSNDGQRLAITDYSGEVRVLSMPALTEVGRLSQSRSESDPAHPVLSMAFAPDGLLATTCDSDVCQWDVTTGTGRLLQTLKGHQHFVTGLAFAAGGKTLISISADSTLRFWSWPDGALRLTVAAVGGADGAYALSPSGMMETWADGERGLRCHMGLFAVPMKECRARFQRDGMLAAALGW